MFRAHKEINLFSLFFVLVFCLAGCRTKEEAAQGRSIIRVGLLQHGSSIPLVVAKQKDFFKKRGLEVEFHVVTADQHMPSLLRGDVDLISPSSFPVIFSTFQQNPGKIQCFLVGGESVTGDTLYGLVVRRDSHYQTLEDLGGKTIGSASKFTTVNLRNVLRSKFPGKAQATTIREVGDPSLLIEGLQRGTLDAAVVDQPALSSTAIQGQSRVIEKNFRARYLLDPYWSGAGVASARWLTANRTKYEGFLDAIDEALQHCTNEPNEAKELFIRQFRLRDVSVHAIGMYVYPKARFVPAPDFTESLMKILIESGLLASKFDGHELFYHQ